MSVTGSYRMQQLTREESAAADPFGGRGVFLEAPGAGSEEILARLAACIGANAPAVAWDDIGAWVDPGSNGISEAELKSRWSASP